MSVKQRSSRADNAKSVVYSGRNTFLPSSLLTQIAPVMTFSMHRETRSAAAVAITFPANKSFRSTALSFA
jgi:hypothetical protein